MTTRSIPFSLTIAMAVTMMLAPFSMDTYLPAFPSIAASLDVSLAEVSRSVSIYIFALALSQLIGGALSDQIGRRQVLIAGLVMYAIASLGIAFAPSMFTLLVGRACQAFGAGWVVVSVPALVRDRISGQEAAKLFSIMGFIVVLAPGIAPSIGSAILALGNWHYIFGALSIYAVLLIPLSTQVILKDVPRRGPVTQKKSLLTRYREVLAVRPARLFLIWQASCFSIMMIFITFASFIYQEHFGLSESQFSLFFAANIATMLTFNTANRWLLSRWASIKILRIATLCQIAGAALLVGITLADLNVYFFLPAMMLTIGAMGAMTSNLQACFLEFFPHNGGAAAALFGATYTGVAGLLSALTTLLPQNLLSIILAMAACAAVSFIVLLRSMSPSESKVAVAT
ncbi:multidrug effflux MFS transporter [Pelagicoccus albus]|uniref:Multidrug effflux MFS transporter n=1 Tax=Pelagicoccus albus TaxID=415222 RepID=A0A7X1B7G1_9BACT|nr:multidrug effflux MFS transporter [Pelagicoccus albus]MBC2607079.1 multidrug effflux MFS transporter [Pelagicoccus albus]